MIDRRPLPQAFLEHRDQLLRYLRARGAGDAAQDLLQDLWLKLDANRDVTIVDPAAYLFRMAHNLMLDRARSETRHTIRNMAYQDENFSSGAPVDALKTLIAREELGEAAAILGALGPRTDQIFRLFRIDGVPQTVIADRLGLSLSAVEKHLQKAYRALAALEDRS